MCWRITSTLTFIVFKVETLFFALPRSQQIWLTKTLSIIRTSLKIGKKCLIQVMSLLFNNDNLNHQPPMQPGSFSSKWTLWKMWFFQLINEIQRMCCSHLRTQLVWYTHSTGCPFSPFVERVAANRGWTFLHWGLGGKKHQRSSKRLNPFHSWLTRTKSADAHDFPVWNVRLKIILWRSYIVCLGNCITSRGCLGELNFKGSQC